MDRDSRLGTQGSGLTQAEAEGRDRGLVIVHTGNGKGKTTAALGLALRAVGQGMRVAMIQFIKGSWRTGEQAAAKLLGEQFELHTMGLGFTRRHPGYSKEKNQAAAARALAAAREKLTSGAYDLVILDEINYAIEYDLIQVGEVLDLIAAKPPAVHLVLTGRHARPEVIERADLVTEMQAVKHPFTEGGIARRGIEF